MKYHLDTIPLWEVMEQRTECLFCSLNSKLEQAEVESSLGGGLMEPAVRMQVNALGFCERHHQQLLGQKNRLGHALLLGSHCKDLLQKLQDSAKGANKKFVLPFYFGKRFSNKRSNPFVHQLEALSVGCIICRNVHYHLQRYYHTFLHLWKNNPAFVKLWENSNGPCVPHSARLLCYGQQHLSPLEAESLANSVLALLKAALTRDEADLEYFTQQFDYQNQGRPWNECQNALERTIKRLRGGFTDEE